MADIGSCLLYTGTYPEVNGDVFFTDNVATNFGSKFSSSTPAKLKLLSEGLIDNPESDFIEGDFTIEGAVSG